MSLKNSFHSAADRPLSPDGGSGGAREPVQAAENSRAGPRSGKREAVASAYPAAGVTPCGGGTRECLCWAQPLSIENGSGPAPLVPRPWC